MARLRRKLETDPAHPQRLLTEPGMGYTASDPDLAVPGMANTPSSRHPVGSPSGVHAKSNALWSTAVNRTATASVPIRSCIYVDSTTFEHAEPTPDHARWRR